MIRSDEKVETLQLTKKEKKSPENNPDDQPEIAGNPSQQWATFNISEKKIGYKRKKTFLQSEI
jgi:hypothetical protein